jgi:hypothetical protein
MAERGDEQAAAGKIVAYEGQARAGAAGAGVDDSITDSTIMMWDGRTFMGVLLLGRHRVWAPRRSAAGGRADTPAL